MTGYRKLIAAACGGIPPNEVDSFLENIREVRGYTGARLSPKADSRPLADAREWGE